MRRRKGDRPSDKHTCDARRLQRRDEPTHHRARRDARDDPRATRRERAQDADLDAEAAEVGEAAERVARDRVRARAEGRVRALVVHDALEGGVGDKLVRDELRREQLRHREDLVPRDGEEEGDGVEDVAEEELEGERVDAEALADPGQQAVDGGDEGDDGEDVGPVRETSAPTKRIK